MHTDNTTYLLQQFNLTVDSWIGYLKDYTPEMLCQQPKPGSWSIGQMYAHIINETNYYIKQMEIGLHTTANSDIEMIDRGKAMFAAKGLPDILIDGPATGKLIPQPQNPEVLLQQLLAIKHIINDLFNSPHSENKGGKTQHPGFGFFNALNWLQFADMHMRHHLRQKKRIDDTIF